MVDPKTWAKLTEKGRDVLRRKTETNWELGDIAAQLEATDLARFCIEIGYLDDEGQPHVGNLRMLRATALAWPKDQRVPEASFTAHRHLKDHPDRARLLREKPGMTVREANNLAGKTPILGSKDNKAETAVKLLEDPAVVAAIARSPEYRRVVTLASADIGEQQRREQVRQGVTKPDEIWGFEHDLSRHTNGLARMLRQALAGEYKPLGELEHREVKAAIGEARVVLDWLESYVDSGDRSFEDQLSALLSN